MKRISFILLFTLLISCAKEQSLVINKSHLSVSETNSENSVALEEVLSYVKKYHGYTTKSTDKDVVCITPIKGDLNDTLMYYVQYESGWEVLSADKRTPAVIAFSETGSLHLDWDNESFQAWWKMTKKDMRAVKNAKDEELSFSKEEIDWNKSLWENKGSLRGDHNPPLIIDTVIIDTYEEIVDEVPHMVPAQWSQSIPFNDYCPIINGDAHYPVGCGGVSCGQMLRYFYKKNGSPSSYSGIPMDSLIVIRNLAYTDSLRATARYLAAINVDLGMHYTPFFNHHFSYVWPSEIEDFFSQKGYSASFENYDVPTVKSKLLQMNPILMLAFAENDNGNPEVFSGHYFLIDGYLTMRHVIRERYCHYSSGLTPIIEDDYYVYHYGSPYVAYVKMNWGQDLQWMLPQNYDYWYSLTGDWVMCGTDNYTWWRKMLIFS